MRSVDRVVLMENVALVGVDCACGKKHHSRGCLTCWGVQMGVHEWHGRVNFVGWPRELQAFVVCANLFSL